MFSKLFNKVKKITPADKQCYPISTLLLDSLLKTEGLESDTPLKQYLQDEKLDYSIESLHIVDKYLDEVRKRKKTLNNKELSSIILRCGAYTGEVMKKNSKRKFTWMFYDDLVNQHKTLKDFEKSILTNFVLTYNDGRSMTFPMSKVEKYLSFGKQESLHFYAEVFTRGKID